MSSFNKENLPGEWVPNKEITQKEGINLSDGLNKRIDPRTRMTFVLCQVKNNNIKLTPKATEITTNNPTELPETRIQLDVNPQNLAFNMTKAMSDTSYTRAGFVPQFWGEELDTISVAATTAAFIAPVRGITRQNARDTKAYSTFLNLLALYKRNGAKYGSYTEPSKAGAKTLSSLKTGPSKKNKIVDVVSSKRKVIDTRFLVKITYLDLIMFGVFDSFNYTESADKPFQFTYSFEFVVFFYNNVRADGHLGRE